MDTSKEYIKMCEKAVDIQELWRHSEGDFVAYGANHQYTIVPNTMMDPGTKNNCVWLPRQDQLQGMVGEFKEIWDRLNVFHSLGAGIRLDSGLKRFNSMEQLWLAFVMKEKFNKIWNGTDWRKK